MIPQNLEWQSKLVLLAVIPFVSIGLVLQVQVWALNAPVVNVWTLGLSSLLGGVALAVRSGTPGAAATGALMNASLMYATAELPYSPVHTAVVPVALLLLMASLATRFGRVRKERLGTAEERHGRVAAQVAANLGLAALVSNPLIQAGIIERFGIRYSASISLFTIALAALAEAAADTISSEIGQVLGGVPRLLTTLRPVQPGTDGGITVAGSIAGIVAAGVVSAAGTAALRGGPAMLAVTWAAAIFGLFFDSLLGATLERAGWLNNDAVNFLSTGSSAAFAIATLALIHG